MSRLPTESKEGELRAITAVQPGWLTDLITSYSDDAEAKRIIEGTATKEAAYLHFQFHKGLIKIGNRIYVGSTGNVRQQILWESHDGPTGGHSGQEATLKNISQFFYWPAMKHEVTKYVQECDMCQRVKTGNNFRQVSYSLSQFQIIFGRTSPWISLKVFLNLVTRTALW